MRKLYNTGWKDYELLDSGDLKKLERFGDYLLIRPEQDAFWEPEMPVKEWRAMAHGEFVEQGNLDGTWKKYKQMPNEWTISYLNNAGEVNIKLQLTRFKHIGVFPEHRINWDFIAQYVKTQTANVNFLNLFGYTGISSLFAGMSGAHTTHVDSVSQVVKWGKENMEASDIDGIRWLVDDASSFVKREIRRENIYQGIILDPPTFGFGTKGRKWKIEKDLTELLEDLYQIIDKERGIVILNTYSSQIDEQKLQYILSDIFSGANITLNALHTKGESGRSLDHGILSQIDFSKE